MADRPIPPAVAYEPRIKTRDTDGADVAALRAAAEAGDTWSQGRLAYVLHEQGADHFPEAERWLRGAAEAGDVQAQALLGEWLRSGWGAAEDPREAVSWISRAAEACYPGAEYDMGMIYFHGCGDVAPDHAESRYWFARSAAHGHPQAAEHGRQLLDPTLAERLAEVAGEAIQAVDRTVKAWVEGERRGD